MKRKEALTFFLALGLTILVPASHAAAFPDRPVKLIVGFAAGGITDSTARSLVDEMGKALGQPVIVDNRAGAGGNIASAELARAAPDGYTIMLATPGQLVVNPLTQKSLGFDPKTNFTLISMVNESPFVLVVPANSKFKSAAELIAWGRANEGMLSYASPGLGTTMHVGGELLQIAAGIKAVHVPYRGGAQSTNDLVAGRVDFMIDSLGAVAAQVNSGQLKVLASAGAKRLEQFPQLPMLSETFPGLEVSSWLGVVAPPNLPLVVQSSLVAAVERAMASPRYASYLETRGSRMADQGPKAFASHLAKERRRIEMMVKRTGLTLD